MELKIEPVALFKGKILIDKLRLGKPSLRVIRYQAADYNLSRLRRGLFQGQAEKKRLSARKDSPSMKSN